VVQEPRGTGDAFDAAMRDFYAGIDGGRGAVLFAVCRGKVRRQNSPRTVSAQCGAGRTASQDTARPPFLWHGPVVHTINCARCSQVSEGLDFADANARCVVILGLPFPNAMDPQVPPCSVFHHHQAEWAAAHGLNAV
jgi:Helicase C-terminal domain